MWQPEEAPGSLLQPEEAPGSLLQPEGAPSSLWQPIHSDCRCLGRRTISGELFVAPPFKYI